METVKDSSWRLTIELSGGLESVSLTAYNPVKLDKEALDEFIKLLQAIHERMK